MSKSSPRTLLIRKESVYVSKPNSFTLSAQSPLNGFNQSFNGIEVSELSGYSLVSMAMPEDKKAALAKNIKSADLPEVGKFTTSTVDNTRILGLHQEQNFVLFENESVYANNQAVEYLQAKTKDAAYLSDQSDSWVMLKLSGEKTRAALERVCPLDLHPPTFSTFSVTRTAMEHLAVIIMQTDENEFLLLSPRSSAESFLHMILTSIENIS